MEIEPAAENEYTHKIIFKDDEVEVLSAAYKEHVHRLVLKGNSGSVGEFALWAAELGSADREAAMLTHSQTSIVEVLEEFNERTDEVVTNMPEETRTASFENDGIPRRLRLGEVAGKLAAEIREAMDMPEGLHGDVHDLRDLLNEGPQAFLRQTES